MSDQVTDFLPAVPRDKHPDYLAASLSILLIALMTACMIAALYRNGAMIPYEVAIPP
jgi:hypothetical protein